MTAPIADVPPGRLRAITGETFRSLGTRNFRLFFVGQSISQVGRWLTMIAQTLLVLELADSGVALGILGAAQFGPLLLLGAYAGVLADRVDKRRLLMLVQSLAMCTSLAMAALALVERPPVVLVYLLATCAGFAVAFENPARRSLVTELVPEEQLTNAVSLNSAMMTGSRVVGPALAGLLVATTGYASAFLLDGISFLAVLEALRRMDPEAIRRSPSQGRGRGQIADGFRYVRDTVELRVALVMTAVIGTMAFNFQTVLPLFTTRDLGGSDLTFSLLMSVVSVGSLVGALASARRTTVGLPDVALAALAFGASMAALALAPNQPAAFVLGAGVGLTSIWFMTSSTAVVQLRAAPGMRGRVLALQAMVFLGSTPIGAPIVGALCEAVGARWGLALGAASGLVAGGYGLVASRRADEAALAGTPAEAVVAPGIAAGP